MCNQYMLRCLLQLFSLWRRQASPMRSRRLLSNSRPNSQLCLPKGTLRQFIVSSRLERFPLQILKLSTWSCGPIRARSLFPSVWGGLSSSSGRARQTGSSSMIIPPWGLFPRIIADRSDANISRKYPPWNKLCRPARLENKLSRPTCLEIAVRRPCLETTVCRPACRETTVNSSYPLLSERIFLN